MNLRNINIGDASAQNFQTKFKANPLCTMVTYLKKCKKTITGRSLGTDLHIYICVCLLIF